MSLSCVCRAPASLAQPAGARGPRASRSRPIAHPGRIDRPREAEVGDRRHRGIRRDGPRPAAAQRRWRACCSQVRRAGQSVGGAGDPARGNAGREPSGPVAGRRPCSSSARSGLWPRSLMAGSRSPCRRVPASVGVPRAEARSPCRSACAHPQARPPVPDVPRQNRRRAQPVGASAHWNRWRSARLKPGGGVPWKVTTSCVN